MRELRHVLLAIIAVALLTASVLVEALVAPAREPLMDDVAQSSAVTPAPGAARLARPG